jgi:myo-inositol-1(or 4)-monophosphatase
LPQSLVPAETLTVLMGQTMVHVRAAGALALDFANRGAKAWTKHDASFVTEADLAVDAFLNDKLSPLLPGAGWLSEESTDNPERLKCRAVWVVDPIDGTRSFMDAVPVWVISVALVVDGAPVLAVVYNPSRDEMFESLEGQGARLNGNMLQARPHSTLQNATVCGPSALISILKSHGATGVEWIHALAYRFSCVAAGRMNAAVSRGNAKDWDIAAADLLLRESGAILTDFFGKQPVYNLEQPIHPPLMAAGLQLCAPLGAVLSAIPLSSLSLKR